MPALPPWNWLEDRPYTPEEWEQLEWQPMTYQGHSATEDAWVFVIDRMRYSTALVCADHWNGWLKWFAWLCPSMAPKITINPSFVQYNGITKHGELIHRSIFISDPTSEVSLSDIYHLHGITYESLEIIL